MTLQHRGYGVSLGTRLVFPCLLLCALSLHAADCNLNGVEDVEDIAAAASEDCNFNALPDECEFPALKFGRRGETLAVTNVEAMVSADFDGDGVGDLALGIQATTRDSTLTVLLSDGDGGFDETSHEAGERLTGIAAADLDGDGDVDLVSANSEMLLVFANDGAGAFEEPRETAVPRSTRFVLAADVTGDGQPDLVVTNTSDDTASVLVSRGDLSFAAPVVYRVGDRPRTVAAGDVDGDGDLDLVTADDRSSTLSLLNNQGSGTFGPSQSYTLATGPRTVELIDFDGDGLPEIFAETLDGIVKLRNEGDGAFSAPELLTRSTRGAKFADVDGDGDIDLVFSDASGRALEVLLGDGAGRLGHGLTQNVTTELVETGDLDGDGDLEVVTTLPGDEGVQVLWNGDDALAFTTQTIDTPAPHFIVTRDFNGDGFPDMATPDGPTGFVSVFHNDGAGSFALDARYSVTTEGHLFSLAADDLDGDGDLDIAVPDRVLSRVSTLSNRGDGTFEEAIHYDSGLNPYFVSLVDLDGDGAREMISSDQGGSTLSVYFNDGTGIFAGPVTYPAGDRPWAVEHGDFDGDGDEDLAVANAGSLDMVILENNGDGTFAEGVSYPTTVALEFVVIADLDRDGDLDVTCSSLDDAVAIFDNRGDGTFAPARILEATRAYSVNAADVNLDGVLDLLVTEWGPNLLQIYFGVGDGTFQSPRAIAVGDLPKFAAVADFELDGDMDIVVANRVLGFLTLLYNQTTSLGADVDYLESVCTTLDFDHVSVVSNRGAGSRSGKYLVPARPDVGLLPALFPNLKRFAGTEIFLRESFPERFGGLTADDYADLALRRGTRDYHAGTLSSLRLGADGDGVGDPGSLTVYGFDVDVDPADDTELLTLAEVEDVYQRLTAAFQLEPLVYLPSREAAKDAASLWESPSFTVLILDDEPPPPPPPGEPGPTPTFELRIPEGMEICGTFSAATADRGIREEYELKSVIRLRGGTIALPTVDDDFTEVLLEEVRFGPDRVVAEAVSDGSFRVLVVPGADGTATYRFNYEQEFVLPDGRSFVVALVSPLLLRGQGEEPLDGPVVFDVPFFTRLSGREPFQARLDGVPLVNYGACGYPNLPRVAVAAELEDGTTLRLDERFEEAESLVDTAPATVVSAEVTIGEERRVVTDYFKLIYSALRHNLSPVYWVLFDAPVAVDGVGAVHGVELVWEKDEPRPEPARAAYLGADLEPLSTLGVRSLSRQATVAVFRRGDSNGDGEVNILDAVALLDFLFRRSVAPPCLAATDANDDGRLNVSDAIRVVGALFGRAAAPPAPFPDCGEDPTEDGLTCHEDGVCR